MRIILAESAGFCFGVERAVNTAYSLLESAHTDNIYSYGEIIHNREVLNKLSDRKLVTVNSLSQIVDENGRVIVRAHGVPEKVYSDLQNMNLSIVDMTCPFVKKIHKIVNSYYERGYKIIIVGDSNHPEVIGINGWCNDEAIIIYDDVEKCKLDKITKACVVAQTTITRQKWIEAINVLINNIKHLVINDTICNATQKRQSEAAEIAKKVDFMIVLGSKSSSNTQKLYEVCCKYCQQSYLVEDMTELKRLINENINLCQNDSVFGMTAGASTPADTILSAKNYLTELKKTCNLSDRSEENDKRL